jgi:D-glycero-D-manno-heptose 1,7-bisphosphate phosphatase
MGTPAVFLDRDGTINQEAGYIQDLANLRLIQGAAGAIARLNQRGVPVILATNQSGPARGYYPEAWVHALHQKLAELLAQEGAHLDDVFYCPHLPAAEGGMVEPYARDCDCRKPETGMLDAASSKHHVDLKRSYMIGDKATDVEVGQRAGCRSVLLRSGYGERVLAGDYQWPVKPDHVADTLVDAIDWVLAELDYKAIGPRA